MLLSSSLLADGVGSPSTAEALVETLHFKRAWSMVDRRLRANPSDAQANYLMSRIKVEFGDLDAALRYAERSVSLDGLNADYHGQLAAVCARLASRAAVIHQLTFVHRFKREVEAALRIDPKHLDTQLADMMFCWKAPFVAGGDKHKAFAIAENLELSHPSWGYLGQARMLQEVDDQPRIEKVLLNAVRVNPPNYRAYAFLARFYATVARPPKFDQAEQMAKQAIALDPGSAAAYSALAAAYAGLGRLVELDELLSTAESNVPDDLAPYYEAGRALLRQNTELPRAERYVRKYLTEVPEGREPTQAQARRTLALILEKQGRRPDAVSELRAALRLEPDFELAKKDLKRIR